MHIILFNGGEIKMSKDEKLPTPKPTPKESDSERDCGLDCKLDPKSDSKSDLKPKLKLKGDLDDYIFKNENPKTHSER